MAFKIFLYSVREYVKSKLIDFLMEFDRDDGDYPRHEYNDEMVFDEDSNKVQITRV